MGKPHKKLIQMSFSVPPEVRATLMAVKMVRYQSSQTRLSGAEIVEDALRYLLEAEKQTAVEDGVTLIDVPGMETGPVAVPALNKLPTQKPVEPLKIPHFELMPDKPIPNFTDEEIAALLKKVAEGAP